jgi:HSP20 family molecular chaperone IbpA
MFLVPVSRRHSDLDRLLDDTVERFFNAYAQRKEGGRVVYRERRISRFARRFTLPAEVDQSESGARVDGGVLTLKLAKMRVTQSTQLEIS